MQALHSLIIQTSPNMTPFNSNLAATHATSRKNQISNITSPFQFQTQPEAETVKDQGTDIPDVIPAAADKVYDDESMTIGEILLIIPADCPLPSALGEIKKIKLGKSILIPGVNEGDWYKASLPKISVDVKGKTPLVIVDPVKGNPAKEQFSFICADIEVLLQSVASSVFEDQSVQMFLDQRPFSSSTSDDSSICFDENDTAATLISLPAVATDFIESFARLRASIDQVQFEQIKRRNDADKLKDILILHIRDLEKQVNARFGTR
ncbi:hypothetical protein F511_29708 [Dorcoceras hygrometricum]|uniref:Uncharacterized protein n=1 Tax=Dorcoceras hygrometricum TaxID=472368 RepID=A0A2Z7C0I1_9LAMI|nr:hypothetical protein F511_29708 [Dorcoceras hygrometricum]